MDKFIKFLKRFLGIQKYKLYLALVERNDTIGVVIAYEEVESNLINKDTIAKNCGCSVEDVTIIKECVVSQGCAWELSEALRVKNIWRLPVEMNS